jgi:multidrug efflux pump subunit AcrB
LILTVCLTLALFVYIPKGFFPQQDTGMIVGISEGAQEISPQAKMERQEAVLNVVVKDPAGQSSISDLRPDRHRK